MRSAAELEEATEKHNITPGPIATARELYGDLLMDARPAGAGRARIRDGAQARPGPLQGASGRGRAAELAGDRETAKRYYARLVAVAATADSQRPELGEARAFVSRQ